MRISFEDLTRKLCDLVERHVDLHMPDDDGVTLYQSLEKLRIEKGIIDPRLFPPVLPIGGERIWKWFWQLDNGREEGFNGLAKISHTLIASWAATTRTVLRGHEVRILLEMDKARLKASSPKAVEARAVANRENLNPDMFDRMFGRNGKRSDLFNSLRKMHDSRRETHDSRRQGGLNEHRKG